MGNKVRFILEAESIEKLAEILRSEGRNLHELILSDHKEGLDPDWTILEWKKK